MMDMWNHNQNLLVALQLLVNAVWGKDADNLAGDEEKPIVLEGPFAVLFFANALPEGHPWVGGNGKENKNMEGVLTGVW
jgi:hypothetical protein